MSDIETLRILLRDEKDADGIYEWSVEELLLCLSLTELDHYRAAVAVALDMRRISNEAAKVAAGDTADSMAEPSEWEH